MGFSVTAASAILFGTALASGVTLGTVLANVGQDVRERQVEDWDRKDARVHTNVSITSRDYNNGADRLKLWIKNHGTTSILVSRVNYIIDGVWVGPATVEQYDVNSDSATDLWLPREEFEVWLRPIANNPTRILVVTENGATAMGT